MSNDFELNAKNMLRLSENGLPAEDVESLRDLRARALEEKRRKLPAFLAPATGLVVASLLAFTVMYGPTFSGFGTDSTAGQETAEFYEDLDFYYWLSANEDELRG
ncbi:MAG: hypothetical protein ACWA5K_05240 [bacterium]